MYSFHLKIFAHSITREKKYRQFQFTILKIRIQNWIWQEKESIYRRVKFFLAIQFNRSHWKMVFSKSKSETLGKLGELPMNALLLYKFMFSHLIRQMYVAESIACTKNTNKIESIIDFADSITSAEHPNNALISTFQCSRFVLHYALTQYIGKLHTTIHQLPFRLFGAPGWPIYFHLLTFPTGWTSKKKTLIVTCPSNIYSPNLSKPSEMSFDIKIWLSIRW